MNKKALIIAGVIVLLLLGGWYFMSRKSTSESKGGVKSLKDLLASGVAQKCTFSTTDESGATEGTTYVSGGKVRADYSTTVSAKTTKSHMISDGKTSYIWTEGEKNGFKMTVPEATPSNVKTGSTDTSPDTSTNSEADLNQKADYKCSAWVVDGSFFTPPSNVTFSDFSQMFAPTSTPSKSGSSSQCSYCNSLSGDDKTQCLAALKCN